MKFKTMFLLCLTPLLSAAHAQTANEACVKVCAQHCLGDDMLACFGCMANCAQAPASAEEGALMKGGWMPSSHVDEMSDEKIVQAYKYSEGGFEYLFQVVNPKLIIYASDSESVKLIIDYAPAVFMDLQTTEVVIRVDKNPPIRLDASLNSESTSFTISNKKLLKQMRQGKTLLVRASPVTAENLTIQFDLTGFANAWKWCSKKAELE